MLGKLTATSVAVLVVAETVLAQRTMLAAVLRAGLVLSIPLLLGFSGFYDTRELQLLRSLLTRKTAALAGRAG